MGIAKDDVVEADSVNGFKPESDDWTELQQDGDGKG